MPEHQRIEDLDLAAIKLRILVYGPWGSGKTWFAGTAPKPHFLCTEDGIIGLRVAGVQGGFTKFSDFNDFLVALGDIELGRVPQFETLCLDGLSELGFLIYRQVKKEVGKEILRLQDWGLVTDRTRMCMSQIISICKNKGYHLIVTAREDAREDEETKSKFFGPDILGSYRKAGPGAFDMVLYSKQSIEWLDGKRYAKFSVSTIASGNFPAKDRTGTLDIEEPNNFPAIQKKFASAKRSALPILPMNAVGVTAIRH